MSFKMELLLKFEFEASHSLAGFEAPHPHLWKLELGIRGEPQEGRIIDIIALRKRLELLIQDLALTYLNDNSKVSPEVRQFPTCETLSQFFGAAIDPILTQDFKSNHPTVCMSFVQVAICDLDGHETGAARVTF